MTRLDQVVLLLLLISVTTSTEGKKEDVNEDGVDGEVIIEEREEIFEKTSSNDNNAITHTRLVAVTELSRFQQIALQYYIKHTSQQPLCVLFIDDTNTNDKTQLEISLQDILNSGQFQSIANGKLKLGTYPISKKARGLEVPLTSPVLRCYQTSMSYKQYNGLTDVKDLTDWLHTTFTANDDIIQEACQSTIDDMISNVKTTILAFPGEDNYANVQQLLLMLRNTSLSDDVQYLMVSPNSAHEELLLSRFQVQKFPTLVMINGEDWEEGSVNVFKRLHKSEVRKEIVEFYLTIMKSSMQKFSLTSFQEEVVDLKNDNSPTLVCFLAQWAKDVTRYLKVLERTRRVFSSFGVNIKFRLVDVREETKIVPRFVKVTSAKSVPFIVFFWHRKDDKKGQLEQKLLSGHLPTPLTVYEFMSSNGVPFIDNDGVQLYYSTWSTHTDQPQVCKTCTYTSISPISSCYSNTTLLSEEEEKFYYPASYYRKKDDKERSDLNSRNEVKDERSDTPTSQGEVTIDAKVKGELLDKLQVLTDSAWSQTIESSSTNRHPFESTSSVRVALVIFVQADCGSCVRKMDVFQDIAESFQFIDGHVSVYILNCTSSPVTCQQQHIIGFPTIIAYRQLSWLDSVHCVSTRLQSHYTRLDYHGAIVQDHILEWFSQIILPTVQIIDQDGLKNYTMVEDVRLTASIYPKSVAGKYLPQVSGVSTWYPLQCFQLVCERLHGQAACYAVKTPDIPRREFQEDGDEEMVVAQVEMYRRDGIDLLLFQLGVPMISLLEDEGNSRIHEFHTPHRYTLKAGQRCEDDHAMCTDIMVDFVEDHRRLPVTHLTLKSFHTSSSWQRRNLPNDLFSSDLLILIALVHKNDTMDDSPLVKNLTSVAYSLYNSIIVTTVDVDEFPAWASQFVPVDYRRQVVEHSNNMTEDTVPSLYVYPRLCMVNWTDHRRAAFYPPITEFQLVNKTDVQRHLHTDEILQFAKNVVENEKIMMIKTEHF